MSVFELFKIKFAEQNLVLNKIVSGKKMFY